MFDNIGRKIKTLAQAVCWIGIVCSVISGIVTISIDDDLAFLGIIIIVIGSLISWVSSFTLYGFGQLIENTDQLVLNAEKPYSNKKATQTNIAKKYTYTEEDSPKDIQKETAQNPKFKTFLEEIKATNTADLELILQDQKDLYTKEEINLIEKELKSRTNIV